mgnify:CR=1 FL=1|tara:strand:- start:18672 stop:20105 length:1434 start_codon:yes stop_codon:yes gene_type:complete
MSIKRFYATKDNTITNAYKPNLTTRATGSNMGASDILEIFSIYGQAYTSSNELARILIQFDTSGISSSRSEGDIPASGSVDFYLRMFNCPHQHTVPSDLTVVVAPITSSWDEGVGLDMDEYTEDDASNWIFRSAGNEWSGSGGDFATGSLANFYSQTLSTGLENIEIKVTRQVEEWINENTGNYGFGVFITSSQGENTKSYYTKKFFGRTSEFFFKRPVLEARWDSSKKDNRGNFTVSSSLLPAAANLNKLYLYNVHKGAYTDIPNLTGDKLIVSLYRDSLTDTAPTSYTASKVETGIYSASVHLNTTASVVYDVWSTGSYVSGDLARATQFRTGSIDPETHVAGIMNPSDSYIINITNLKKSYDRDEETRFRVYARNKNWNPNIYSVASSDIETTPIDDLYYKITREADDLTVIDYGTGSIKYTATSYDVSGNYFDLDMKLLESGYSYIISFLAEENGNKKLIKNTFRFRVEESNS